MASSPRECVTLNEHHLKEWRRRCWILVFNVASRELGVQSDLDSYAEEWVMAPGRVNPKVSLKVLTSTIPEVISRNWWQSHGSQTPGNLPGYFSDKNLMFLSYIQLWVVSRWIINYHLRHGDPDCSRSSYCEGSTSWWFGCMHCVHCDPTQRCPDVISGSNGSISSATPLWLDGYLSVYKPYNSSLLILLTTERPLWREAEI